jgi:O-antigen/teichoic acid export membrane protein
VRGNDPGPGIPSASIRRPGRAGGLFGNSIWVFAGKVMSTLAKLATAALVARLLAPSEVGLYFIVVSVVGLGTTIAQVGTNKTVVRLVAESMATARPSRAKGSVRMVVRIAGLGSLGLAAIFVLGGGRWLVVTVFHSRLSLAATVLVAGWIVASALYDLLADVFRGFHQFRLATLFEGLGFTILSVLFLAPLWVLWRHASLTDALIASTAAAVLNMAVAALVLRPRIRSLPDGEGVGARLVLSIAWPLLITNVVLYALASASDIWVVGAFRSHQAAASYGAAVRLMTLVQAPGFILQAILPPMIAAMYARGERKELEGLLRAAAGLATIPSALALIAFIGFGGPVMGVLFGPFYRQGATILILLSLGQAINVYAGPCGLALQMTGHQKVMMAITALCGVMSVVGGIWLVQRYGGVGVAAATTAALTLQNALMVIFSKRRLGIWTHASFSPSAIRDLARARNDER